MDAVWILAALVIMVAALGVAIWLVKLGKDMAGYVAQAQRAVDRLDAAVAAAEVEQAAAHRADPHGWPDALREQDEDTTYLGDPPERPGDDNT